MTFWGFRVNRGFEGFRVKRVRGSGFAGVWGSGFMYGGLGFGVSGLSLNPWDVPTYTNESLSKTASIGGNTPT